MIWSQRTQKVDRKQEVHKQKNATIQQSEIGTGPLGTVRESPTKTIKIGTNMESETVTHI